MDPVQVVFPPDWDESIKTRVSERGSTSVADYLRELVAADIEPISADDRLDRLIQDGLDSPLEGPTDDFFWAERLRRLRTTNRGPRG